MKLKKLPRSEFFKTLILVLVPYFLVQVFSLAVTEPKPSFWVVNAIILTAMIIGFTSLYVFAVERKDRS